MISTNRSSQEVYRALKPGGHFSVSDVVLEGQLSDKNTKTAEMYAGCISGAIQKKEYLNLIRAIGFENITVQKEKTITVPDDILANYLSPDEIKEYKESDVGILSVTVVLFFYG